MGTSPTAEIRRRSLRTRRCRCRIPDRPRRDLLARIGFGGSRPVDRGPGPEDRIVDPAELQHLRLFSGVDDDEIGRLLGDYRVKHFAAGDLVFAAGQGCRELFLLLEGIVKTYDYSPQGFRQIIHVFYPGHAFGGLVFGSEQERWAEAMEDAAVLVLDETDFKQLMQSFPDVCLNILDDMVEHHTSHVRRMQSLLHTRAGHRLALTLLHLGDLQGDADSAEFALRGGFTHRDLASMIGVVRSTVSELFGELRARGVVRGERREIRVDRLAAEEYLSSS